MLEETVASTLASAVAADARVSAAIMQLTPFFAKQKLGIRSRFHNVQQQPQQALGRRLSLVRYAQKNNERVGVLTTTMCAQDEYRPMSAASSVHSSTLPALP